MKKLLPLFFLGLFSKTTWSQIIPNAAGVLFVKKGSTGNGSSWTNAVGELSDALKAANGSATIQQVWVAAGVYLPGYKYPDNNQPATPGDRENTFSISRSYKVYGHFAGTEQTTTERQLNNPAFSTVLSGDFNNNDRITSASTDISFAQVDENAYTVLTISASIQYELDGFTITGGNCPANLPPGAGMKINFNARSVLSNLRITTNISAREGAAIHTNSGRLIMFNCFIANNHSAQNGGGMYCINFTEASINNTVFARNFGVEGAALYSKNGNISLINCTLVENNGPSVFNAISGETPSTVYIYNNIIRQTSTGNTIFPSQLTGSAQYVVRNCILQTEHFNGSDAPGASFTIEDPLFSAPASLDYRIRPNSPAVDRGANNMYNISWHGFNLQTDLDMNGTRRLIGSAVDIGAYELTGQLQQISLQELSGIYGDPDFEIPVSASSGLPVTISSSDPAIADVYQSGNKWMMKMKVAGTVTITARQAGDANFLGEEKQVNMEVKKRVVTIYISERSKTYGEADPWIGYTFSGNISGEWPLGFLKREPGENAGQYKMLTDEIHMGVHAPNYIVNIPQVYFTILPKTIYVLAEYVSKNYGKPDPPLTYSAPGLLPGDAFTGTISREPGENAGVYNITQGTLESGPNYDIVFLGRQLTIYKLWLRIGCEPLSRPYGEANPAVEFIYDGFATGEGPESITTLPEAAIGAGKNSLPGWYSISLSGGTATNYNFLLDAGVLHITGAEVAMQQQPQSMSICESQSADFSVVAEASSDIVNLTYQWQRSNNGNSNWQNMSGEQTNTLTGVSEAGYYRCAISAPGTLLYSDAASLVRNKAAVPTILVADKVCMDEGILELKAFPEGGSFTGPAISNNQWNMEIPNAGKHTIHYSYADANGCTGRASKVVELQTCGTRGGGISIMNILAFPNPTPGPVSLRLLVGIEDNWFINVSNLEGRSVQQKQLFLRKGWNTVTLDLSSRASGPYSLSLGRGGRWKKSIMVIKK